MKKVTPVAVAPRTIRRWWMALIAMLLATLAAESLVVPHPYFGVDGTLFFHAWYGFASCVGIVIVSNMLGALLKRKDTYYKTEDKR